MKSPTSFKKILTSRPATQHLLETAANLAHLNQRLAKLLPDSLTQHCKIAAVQQGTLVIVASSSAWATRLRLQQSKIIKGFKDIPVQSLSIQITPEAKNPPQPSRMRPRTMSQQTSKLLIELSETTSDPKLKQALRRLSQRARNRS